MSRRTLALVLAYLSLMFLFGGRYGLIVAIAVLVAWRMGVPRPAFWAAAALLMAAAPVTLMAQGLPSTPVVGANFGTGHMVAHVLTGLALALAGFAGMCEMAEHGIGPPAGTDRGGEG